ncbi:MAG: hypothetical protein ACXACY_27745 [Candidatus Hodarchaeales archaeon]|jgi:hypothetical protein
MKFKDYYKKSKDWAKDQAKRAGGDIKRAALYDVSKNIGEPALGKAKELFKADVGKHAVGLMKGLNPLSKGGVLGKSLQGLKKAENYLKTGGVDKARDSVEKWREYKIYPQEDNANFNNQVKSILNVKFPIKPGTQHHFFGKWVVYRKKDIKSAAHIANLVMDQYVKNLQKQIPKNKSLQIALNDTIVEPDLKRFIDNSGMIAAV